MHSTDIITDHGLSPVADNIFMLRYAKTAGELRPSLAVVKTRGSAHEGASLRPPDDRNGAGS